MGYHLVFSNFIRNLSLLESREQKNAVKNLSQKQLQLMYPMITDVALKKIFVRQMATLSKKNNHAVRTAPNKKDVLHQVERIIQPNPTEKKQVPERSSPTFVMTLRASIENLIQKFYALFEADTKAFFKHQTKLEPNERWIEVPPLETQEMIESLAKETESKVQKRILFSSSFFGLTIGELVKKNGGAELFYLGSCADGCFADEIEWNTLNQIKNDEMPKLTRQEQEGFNYYFKSVEKCRDINKALDAYWDQVEGLSTDLEESRLKNPQEQREKIEKLAKFPYAFSNEIFNRLKELKIGEAISLNIGHYNHGMQMSISKTEQGYDMTLYDSGSGLEFMFLSKGLVSRSRLLSFYQGGYPARCGISLKVSHQEFEDLGKQYLKNMIERSCINYDEKVLYDRIDKKMQSIEKNLKNLPNWNLLTKTYYHLKLKWLSLKEVFLWGSKWERTVKIFGSIAPDTVELIPELLGSQWICNCTSKRLRAIQLGEMGYSAYQKVNASLHEYSKKVLLESAKENQYLDDAAYEELIQLKPLSLDKKTLREASLYLSQFNTFPPHQKEPLSQQEKDENYQAAKYVILLMNHNLSHLIIPNRAIRTKENLLPKATSQELSILDPSTDDLSKVTLIKRFRGDRSKARGVEMEINGQRKEVSKLNYFKLILKKGDSFLEHDINVNLQFLSKDKKMTLKEKILLKRIFTLQAKKMLPLRQKMLNDIHQEFTKKLSAIERESEDPNSEADLIRADQRLDFIKIKKVLSEIEQAQFYLSQMKNAKVDRVKLTNSFFMIKQNCERWNQILLSLN